MEKDSALKYEKLQKRLKEMGRLVVSFSGGVDSTFLLAVAREVIGDQVTAVTAAGRSVPEWEIEEAREFCRERGIRHIVFSFDELEVDGFADNPPDRCYHCKTAILQKVREAAEQVDTVYIAEGSNVDDDGDYRPGKRAVQEAGVISPLKEAAPDCKVMVGGAVLTADYAEKIGADYYCKDAMKSVEAAQEVFHG